MKKILYSLFAITFIIFITGYRTLQVDTINMQHRVLENIDRVTSSTPLHMAVIMANVDEVKAILNGSSHYNNPGTVNSKDGQGHYPLYYAGQYRASLKDYIFGRPDIEITELLIKNGADVNANDGEAIDLALQGHGNIEFMKILFKNNFDIKNTYALHRAALKGLLEQVKLLISYGADVNERDKEGKTPLEAAKALFNDETIINELKKAGAKE